MPVSTFPLSPPASVGGDSGLPPVDETAQVCLCGPARRRTPADQRKPKVIMVQRRKPTNVLHTGSMHGSLCPARTELQSRRTTRAHWPEICQCRSHQNLTNHCSVESRSVSRCAAATRGGWWRPVGVWEPVGGLGTGGCRCAHVARHAQAQQGVSVPTRPVIVEGCVTDSVLNIAGRQPRQKENAPQCEALPKRQLHKTHLGCSAPVLWPASELSAFGVSAFIHVWRRP